MDWVVIKMLLAGLMVALIINLLIPPRADARVSRPTIAFLGVAGSVAGRYVGWKAFGFTRGTQGVAAMVAGAVILILAYLLITPSED